MYNGVVYTQNLTTSLPMEVIWNVRRITVRNKGFDVGPKVKVCIYKTF